MRDLILEKVRDSAELLGLPRERVMTKSEKDNITLPRPRIELDFLPETFKRTGRLLGLKPTEAFDKKMMHKELWLVRLPVAAQVLAVDPDWLKEFCYRLVAALPRGFNDRFENYVEIDARQGQWEGFTVKRVGDAVINPLPKHGYLIHLNITWRITEDQVQQYITEFNFNPTFKNHGDN